MKKKRARTKTESLRSRSRKAAEKTSSRPSRPQKPHARKKNSGQKRIAAHSRVGRLAASGALYPHDLPFSYNKTALVLLVRDTEWAYAYWDFSGPTWEWIRNFFKQDPGAKAKLRIYPVEARSFFDLEVQMEAKNWYARLGNPNTEFEAELGILDSQGRFHCIAKSNRVKTPRNQPSEKIDPDWDPKNFDELYRLSGGGQTGKGSEFFSSFAKKRI